MYYKEKELYNGTERVYLEEYKYSWIGECCRVGLCVNSLIIFCRADNNCTDGHEYLSQTNRASSWLNNLDTLCPKVAWGITAWLLVYTNTDSKKRLIYGNDTKRGVFSKYKAECEKRYRYANKEDYDYYKANEDEVGIKHLDEAFYAEHIKQEREYIRRFTRPECITEEYYQAILQCSNEYIKWVDNDKRQEEKATAPISTEDTYYENPPLHYDRLLGNLKEWNDSEKNTRHIQIIDRHITAEEFRHGIRTANVKAITAAAYRGYVIKQLIPYFSNEWLQAVEESEGKPAREIKKSKPHEEFQKQFSMKRYEIK